MEWAVVRGRRAPGKDVLNTRFKDDVIKGLTNKIRIVTEFEWKIVSSSTCQLLNFN
jgi:hypothetical protein